MKKIPNHPGYFATEDGEIYSTFSGKFLTQYVDGKGYCQVSLRKGNYRVHRLILLTFVGKPKRGQESRHLDGDKDNNAFSNLCWGTSAENEEDKRRHGTNPQGGKHHNAKLTDEDVQTIRREYRPRMGAKLARRFGVSQPLISQIVNKKARV